ncbi:hypothetical protein KUCAC02_005280 [Chaenocephalus aceratus]|uniref:Uncharacterized protein n=1 Tax=Chaenocephalus aceratus TaxID=36190 RepID=A0ACB9WPH9_CHAAC|nr:hypothetical protein KUCAC02_005280 [Chaenocephalus aceratus]
MYSVCILCTVMRGWSMLPISPAALSGSMGVKGAVSSGMEAYKYWSSGLPLPAGVGMKSSVTQRRDEEAGRRGRTKRQDEEAGRRGLAGL